LYAACDPGLFKSTDRGSSWTASQQVSFIRFRNVVVDPDSPALLYAATFGAGVLKSSDGGTTWTSALPGQLSALLLTYTVAIDSGNAANVYAGTRSGVLRTTDRGQTWQLLGKGIVSERIFALATDPSNGRVLYAGGDRASDAFLLELNRAGTRNVFSTYLGGGSREFATALAVDGKGSIYVAGYTDSFNFPVTRGAFEASAVNLFGGFSGFVSKVTPDANP